jgi:ribonuclease HII
VPINKSLPTLELEQQYFGKTVIGIDEVGRGCLAGPVVACAIALEYSNIPPNINDSKKLKAAKRQAIYDLLLTTSSFAIGQASVAEIDQLNILHATMLAMRRAYDQLLIKPDIALIDGNQLPDLPCIMVKVIGGDGISLSIAAASIMAKVYRDKLMAELALHHPAYGFENNAGYGTPAHLAALRAYGHCQHHRLSFAPMRLSSQNS